MPGATVAYEPPVEVTTTSGPAAVERWPGDGVGTVLLTHGSAGSIHVPDLDALAIAAHAAGWDVVAVTQPFRVAGRRNPGDPARQDAAWLEVVRRPELVAGEPRPLVLAGRSNGARVATRTATAAGAAGVVALAFPVHPPGRPERSRIEELRAPVVPVLVVQGGRDPFGVPPRGRGRRTLVVPAADHALRGAGPVITREVRTFLRALRR